MDEVRYYYTRMGLHPACFAHFAASRISRHIQCLLSAKTVAEARGESELQVRIENKHGAFFLATLHPAPSTFTSGSWSGPLRHGPRP